MKVISTKVEDLTAYHLEVLAWKHRTTTAAMLRKWIAGALKFNPITKADEVGFARYRDEAQEIPGLVVPAQHKRRKK